TLGSGLAGRVNVVVSGQATITGSGLLGETRGSGAGGDVSLQASELLLTDGATISSSSLGSGNAGRVNVVVSGQATITGSAPGRPSGLLAETRGSGAGGDVSLQASELLLTDGATISSSTLGSGLAGRVNVVVSGQATITGSGLLGETRGSGAGGDVSLQASELLLTDGATISSSSLGSGNAGRVNVVVSGQATITGSASGRPSGLLAETRGSGAGGDVSLQASVLQLTDGATISSSSLGSGLAGNIGIRLSDSLDMQGGIISTHALTSDGGNIRIVAPRLIHLVGSQITTSVQSGAGGGGNIFIDPQFVILQNSQIIANAFGGPGGNINIVAGQLIADPTTVITASSALGIAGSVNIDAPDTDVSAGLAVLPVSFLDAASLLRAGCGGARAGLSSLVEVGRGGLPPDPDGYLPSLDLGTLAHGTALASRADRWRATALQPALQMIASLPIFGCGP
ncbi:MAG: S-layer family protein, partial [Burkholderiaceae bacterium]|nr:S-layer family protein [Burkholderiaceae bacterium]